MSSCVVQVKVNYTRKIQHFCAYLIPLTVHVGKHTDSIADEILVEWWGYCKLPTEITVAWHSFVAFPRDLKGSR